MKINYVVFVCGVFLVGIFLSSSKTRLQSLPASKAAPRFIMNGNGTVTDKRTGLMWKQCSEGLEGAGCNGFAIRYFGDFTAGLVDTVNKTGFAGYKDWRLPTLDELLSITEPVSGSQEPSINIAVFPNTLNAEYWSNTALHSIGDAMWIVDFSYGYRNLGNSHNDENYVRLVRNDS